MKGGLGGLEYDKDMAEVLCAGGEDEVHGYPETLGVGGL